MALTDDDKQWIRDLLTDAMGGLERTLTRHMDDRLLEVEVELGLVHERLDTFEVDFRSAQTHLVKSSRQQMKDRLKLQKLETKVDAIFASKEKD